MKREIKAKLLNDPYCHCSNEKGKYYSRSPMIKDYENKGYESVSGKKMEIQEAIKNLHNELMSIQINEQD